MYYVISNRGEEIASTDSFTNAVFTLIESPKGAQIFNGETPTGITKDHEAIQLLMANKYLRVCDAFETIKVAKKYGCSYKGAAAHILESAREEPGEPVITEHLQYAGTFGVKDLFFTPANKWK